MIDGSATYSKPLGTTGKVQFFKCPAPPALCALSSDTDETVNDDAIWSKSLASGEGGEYLGPPIVLGDVVYTAGDGVMHAWVLPRGMWCGRRSFRSLTERASISETADRSRPTASSSPRL